MSLSNPAFNDKIFDGFGPSERGDAMTVIGAINRSLVLLLMMIATAATSYYLVKTQGTSVAMPLVLVGGIGGFVVGIATCFKPQWSPISGPIYSLLQGLMLGAISYLFGAAYSGIVSQAIIGTVCVFVVMLLIYRSGLIKVTQKFMIGVAAATGGIALMYIVMMVLRLFGVNPAFMYDSSPLGVGISVVVIIVAALNLILDFDFIQRGAQAQAPKYMEWYAGFGIVMTLVWLYLEMLRLLGRFRE